MTNKVKDEWFLYVDSPGTTPYRKIFKTKMNFIKTVIKLKLLKKTKPKAVRHPYRFNHYKFGVNGKISKGSSKHLGYFPMMKQ